MKSRFEKLKPHFEKMINAGNVVLHLMLGIGIASLFLPWEKSFILQLIICVLTPFAVGMFLEYLQKVLLKAEANIYDAVNTAVGGFLVFIVYIFIYGVKLDSDIDFSQPPRMIWMQIGLVFIIISIFIWVYKNFLKKKEKENS
jgi:membrane protein implicated in regulation of membrane protease activity